MDEQGGFFRREVFIARQGEWLGAVRLQPPRVGWFFFALGLFTMASILAILLAGQYTRLEQVQGSLIPADGLITVTPMNPGVVTRVLVREGDTVHADQPLLEISAEQASTSLGDTHAAIAAQLDIKHRRLKADIDDQRTLMKLQASDLQERLALLHGQIAQIDEQVEIQRKRADSAASLYQQWSKAKPDGVVSKLQLLQQQDAALQNRAQLKDLVGQAFQLRQQAQLLRGQLDQLPALTSAKVGELDRQLADVAQSLSQNEAQRAVVLRSPTDGVISNVLVHPGQAVVAQQSLAAMSPSHSQLLAELWVPTKAVGFIRPGGRVVIRYQAYPYQKFGSYSGRISEVSRSAVPAMEVSRLLGQEIKEPRYKVKVALDSQSAAAYGQSMPLRPGMTLDADLQLDRQRLIDWVLDPLKSLVRPAPVADRSQRTNDHG